MNERGRHVVIGAAVGALVGALAGFLVSRLEEQGDQATLPAIARSLDRKRVAKVGMTVVALVRQLMDLG
ncbi:MAG: hypothetical protein V1772_12345 [Chloroflexota bacterium]